MADRYAQQTTVPVEKTRMEIERTLARYGADAFGYMTAPSKARLAFRLSGRHIRFELPLPDPQADEFVYVTQGARGRQRRSEESRARAVEQASRQRWRALALIIKAKLEAVAAGVTTIEDEFLAHTMLPDGSTVGEWAKPQLEEAYRLGHMPAQLMLGGPS